MISPLKQYLIFIYITIKHNLNTFSYGAKANKISDEPFYIDIKSQD